MNKLLYRGQLIFKDVSWKCTNAVGNENTNQAMKFKIEIIKWQNKVIHISSNVLNLTHLRSYCNKSTCWGQHG